MSNAGLCFVSLSLYLCLSLSLALSLSVYIYIYIDSPTCLTDPLSLLSYLCSDTRSRSRSLSLSLVLSLSLYLCLFLSLSLMRSRPGSVYICIYIHIYIYTYGSVCLFDLSICLYANINIGFSIYIYTDGLEFIYKLPYMHEMCASVVCVCVSPCLSLFLSSCRLACRQRMNLRV